MILQASLKQIFIQTVANRMISTVVQRLTIQNLANSQFHQHGPRHFLKNKKINREQSIYLAQIQKIISQMADLRSKIIQQHTDWSQRQRERKIDQINKIAKLQQVRAQKNQNQNNQQADTSFEQRNIKERLKVQSYWQKSGYGQQQAQVQKQIQVDGKWGQYCVLYTKLEEQLSRVQQGEWMSNTAGWFNLQQFQPHMLQQIFQTTNRQQHSSLLQAIRWMTPHTVELNLQSIQEATSWRAKLNHYYKRLSPDHPPSLLRILEDIMGHLPSEHKRKYYLQYLTTYLGNLKNVRNQDKASQQQTISDLLWLMQTFTAAQGHSQQLIKQMEQYLLEANLTHQQISSLKAIYLKVGGIGEQFYQKHIQKELLTQDTSKEILHQHTSKEILPQNQSKAQQLVNIIQFIVLSQAPDRIYLEQCLQRLNLQLKHGHVSSQQTFRTHLLLHYLAIAQPQINVPVQLHKHCINQCREQHGNGPVARKRVAAVVEQSRTQGQQHMYVSECLRRVRFQDDSQEDPGKKIAKSPGFQQFRNIRFCCIEIDHYVQGERPQDAFIMQRQYTRLHPSGKLIRLQQIKDRMLSHYGWKVNYLQTSHQQVMREQGNQKLMKNRAHSQQTI